MGLGLVTAAEIAELRRKAGRLLGPLADRVADALVQARKDRDVAQSECAVLRRRVAELEARVAELEAKR